MKYQTEVLNEVVSNFNVDFDKFEKGNDSAGARARKSLLHIGKLTKDLRDSIQAKRVENKQT